LAVEEKVNNKFVLLLICSAILVFSCQNSKPQEISPNLFQHWRHSREEDSEQGLVYRPHHYKFPRSRGREGFEFKKDGQFTEYVIAPADGYMRIPGVWEHSDNNLVISFKNKKFPSKRWRIVFINKDKLVLKPEPSQE
jgi:hypothetical protein